MMNWHFTPYALPALCAALISTTLVYYIWTKRHRSLAIPLVTMMSGISWWSLSYFFELCSTDLPTKLFWSNMTYIGVVMVPASWLATALSYIGWKHWLSDRRFLLLAIEPLAVIIIAWTNNLHGLFQSHVDLVQIGSLTLLNPTRGIAFWVHTAYSYSLLLFGSLLFIRAYLTSPRVFKRQATALLAGAFLPWIGNAITLSGLSPLKGLDLSPLMLSLSGILVFVGVIRFRLLDLTPIAHDTVIEQISHGVIVMDDQLQVVDINPAASVVLGLGSGGLRGKYIADLCSDWPELHYFIRTTTEGRDEISLGREGARRVFAVDLTIIKSHTQEPVGNILTLRDITLERHREEELSIAKANLEARVIEQSEKLVQAQATLGAQELELLQAQKLESLGTLAGGLAHDFNNFLMVIMLNLNTAKMMADDNPELVKLMNSAENAIQQAKEITQQLLTFARGRAPVKATMHLQPLLKESMHFVLRGTTTTVAYDFADDLWTVDIDAGQINQVISILVLNAVEAMPHGGTVHLSVANVTLQPHETKCGLPPDRYVKVTVRDEGMGIPPEIMDSIFDPYFSTKSTGKGLGLSSCYSILARHGGGISVESELNLGSTFTFYLPASSGKVAGEAQNLEITHGSGRVLTMDDDHLVLAALTTLLEKLGYDVVATRDGKDTVTEYLRGLGSSNLFDAVILDLTVPGGLGGVDTLKALRQLDPKVKAIATSGYANDPVMANYTDYGFLAILPKPYRVEDLSRTIQTILDQG